VDYAGGRTTQNPSASPGPAGFDVQKAHDEFSVLKQRETQRNYDYFLLRQAVRGNFRWPRNWPSHIDKLKHNLCKPITERFTTFMMGKGFSYNVERPNSLEYREAAERTEKILMRLLELSNSQLQYDMGAKTGSQLGRTVYKVYHKGEGTRKHACFSYCQPDYFYGIPSGDTQVGEYAVVYYSYPMDIDEAKRMYKRTDLKTERQLAQGQYYDVLPEVQEEASGSLRDRRCPVFEAWTADSYLLEVGGQVIFNGKNPHRWKDTGQGFVPYVVIENIRNAGEAVGEADIAQARELNEFYNYLLSRKQHIVGRWLMPTLVWEGAPQNYAQILAQTLAGGGAIPARLGSRLYFLAYDRPNPSVTELEATLRAAILETSGMSELALQGTVQGSINTGPALAAQYQPVLATVDKKRTEWEAGLKKLFRMLLNEQEAIGASDVLGEAVINQHVKSKYAEDGELVSLSGEDIMGLRSVSIAWPGILPKDDAEAARLELEKMSMGVQSIYTTLEKLGEQYPDDEIARIRMENEDPSLKGQQVAEQMRAQGQLLSQQASAEKSMAEAAAVQAPPAPEGEEFPEGATEEDLMAGGDLGARLRALARGANRPENNFAPTDDGEPALYSDVAPTGA
jgi:hypothetical protein